MGVTRFWSLTPPRWGNRGLREAKYHCQLPALLRRVEAQYDAVRREAEAQAAARGAGRRPVSPPPRSAIMSRD
jgi:hypothetical protein